MQSPAQGWPLYSTVRNTDGMPHNFHVHDVQYRVLSLNGKEPPVEMQGPQDTVLVKPDDTVRLLVTFAAYPDPNTPYMFHCHLLRHEDQGMMGHVVVVRPGQQAGSIAAHKMASIPGMSVAGASDEVTLGASR